MSKHAPALAALVLFAWVGACLDDPGGPDCCPPPAGLVVSNPVVSSAPRAAPHAGLRAVVGAGESVVFVSLAPGTIPNGGLATITNARTGASVAAAMAAGGFDPVPLEAHAGDNLTITVTVEGGSTQSLFLTVAAARRPIVVRTNPPPRKRDVPLNGVMVIVFSEPMDPGTAGGITLLQGGAPLGGRAVLSADGLRVSFEPDQRLAANTEYVLSVPISVSDVSGESLEQAVQTTFTAGTTTAVARVATDQTALFINPSNGLRRTLDFEATLRSDGTYVGEFRAFYPDSGWFNVGRVICFAIVDGNKVWVAGVVDSARTPQGVGVAFGWRAVDNDPLPSGLPDQLSLAHPLQVGVLGTPRNFCATTPLVDPSVGQIVLRDLVSGDIVVTGDAPPPPPDTLPPLPRPGEGMSQVAFHSAYGTIMTITVDNDPDNLRTLTIGPRDFSADWSPDSTKLAFQSDRNTGDWNIYSVNWDGSGLTQLTRGAETDQDPAWSPDGTRIAFRRNGVIHVMNANGSNITPLPSSGINSHPSWSPDGARIVFASSRSGTNAIHIMNADGSGVVQLTSSGNDNSPSWSPDGTRIAFARKTGPGTEGLFLINPDGSGLTRLTLGISGSMSWSPDGARLIYEQFGITVINSDGSGMKRWFSGGFNPAWSRAGAVPAAPVPFRSVERGGGDGQVGTVGTTLPESLSVRVLHDNGTPQGGATIRWNTWGTGGGPGSTLSAGITTTDSSGFAAIRLTFGSTPGPVHVRAALVDGTARRAEVVFTATAVPTP